MTIASLEEELAHLKRAKKRKAISNSNKHFKALSEALASGEAIPEKGSENTPVAVECGCSEELESESETASGIEVREEIIYCQTTP